MRENLLNWTLTACRPCRISRRTRWGFAPKDLAALLSETFSIYRNSFLLLLGVSLIGHIPFFIGAFLSDEVPVVITVFVLGFLAGVLANAATTYIVAGKHLGYMGTVAGGYAAAIRVGPYLLASTLIYSAAVGAAVVLSLVVIGIPILVFLLVAWFFYVQTVMIEGKRPAEALSRSWDLVRGNWLRVLGIGVVYVSITLVAVFAASLPGLLVSGDANTSIVRISAHHGRVRGCSALLLCWDRGGLTTVGSAVVAPFSYVGTVVVYLDLRARKEGYDVDAACLLRFLAMTKGGMPACPLPVSSFARPQQPAERRERGDLGHGRRRLPPPLSAGSCQGVPPYWGSRQNVGSWSWRRRPGYGALS